VSGFSVGTRVEYAVRWPSGNVVICDSREIAEQLLDASLYEDTVLMIREVSFGPWIDE